MNEIPRLTPFMINRTFAHPKEKLYRAWTEANALKRWFGPVGWDLIVGSFELRPGGIFHYGMKTADGREMWGKWVFFEIEPNEKLVFVASFSDKDGGLTRHPMSTTWPLETLSTITFTEENGRTTVALQGEPVNATEEEIATFTQGYASMTQGWGGTLDKLEEFLAVR